VPGRRQAIAGWDVEPPGASDILETPPVWMPASFSHPESNVIALAIGIPTTRLRP